MSELSNKPWGDVDKDELLKYVINNPKKAKDIYLKIEPNWEEDPSSRLSYPIADKSGTIYRYGLASAMTYAKANNETQVISKLKKLYKQYGLAEEFNMTGIDEGFSRFNRNTDYAVKQLNQWKKENLITTKDYSDAIKALDILSKDKSFKKGVITSMNGSDGDLLKITLQFEDEDAAYDLLDKGVLKSAFSHSSDSSVFVTDSGDVCLAIYPKSSSLHEGIERKIIEAVVDESKIVVTDIQSIDVNSIIPDKKDMDRAKGLQFRGSTFHGSGAPWNSEASKMAKLIKDPIKLVRRAKAVCMTYGHTYDNDRECDVWNPFRNALIDMGFSGKQIQDISNACK